uniref:Cyclic nucleotide-binding domain-containing protein n=1 Tax=Strombidium rassoulzadegani TaxID=1082188 RepID=A0A7S3FW38_9SPIT|mmetsp:Transcript_13336/g.22663  ORF Transcript_13336/g.22663 Transcript_13336/m.22663 type:complete len:668 (+) Transcript_13336:582-2585(+)
MANPENHEMEEPETKRGKKADCQQSNFLNRLFGENSNRSCQDRIIISISNPVYQAWKIVVVMICIFSSYMYALIAAFGIPEKGSTMSNLDIIFEVIFSLDIIVQFLLEFKPEDQYNKVRDLTEIAKRYLKTRFIWDIIPLIPFKTFFAEAPQSKLSYVVKIIRIMKGYHLLSPNTFMRQVKMVFNSRLERIIKNDPQLAEDMHIDNNNIMHILMISYFFKTFKLVIIILTVSYFMGMFWYVYCDLTLIENPVDQDVGFKKHFELEKYTDNENAIIMTYYAFTTLSTVGFGDYHPRSNAERGICAFILLIGVAIFSYIMGNFIEILISIQDLNNDFDEGESLSKWFGLIKRFNSSRSIPLDLKLKIEEYFDYRWINDKNQAVSTEEDIKLLNQLPPSVQRKIYSDFLFEQFIKNFKKFFDFPKENPNKNEEDIKIDYAFYTWNDVQYQNFMINILKSLEPRQFGRREVIYVELDEVNEILFIEKGQYDIGYEVNKTEKFKLRLGSNTVIGAFNICFNKRQIFIHRTHTYCSGYSIRKSKWKQIMDESPEFFSILKRKVLYEYITKIRKPIMQFKQNDIDHYDTRADFQQVLALRNYDENELSNLISDELDQKGDVNNEMKRIEKLEKQIDRFSRHIIKEIEMFENTLEAIALADQREELQGIEYNFDI